MSTVAQGWKTLLFATALSVAGVLQTFNWVSVIPQDRTWSGIAMVGIGAIVAYLRSITSTPIGTK